MIGVVFPPGCYGTFLAQCLYYFTHLGYSSHNNFVFNRDGSSHEFRSNQQSKQVIWYGHPTSPGFDSVIRSANKLVVLLPQITHALDYFDNQFVKQQKTQVIEYLHTHYAPDTIEEKLRLCWQHEQGLDQHTPIWILREWTSYWIGDVLSASYTPKDFDIFESGTRLTTVELFENFGPTIMRLTDALELELMAEPEELSHIYKEFVSRQQFHLIQHRCEAWIDNILLDNHDVPSPCFTLFDEAYVQHLLRDRGYELQCDKLDLFPSGSKTLREKIYCR
jgi:hypothetical protein